MTAPAGSAPLAAAQAAASGPVRGTEGYRLGAGDKVKIAIYNEDMLSGQYEISGAGMMSLPLIGEVPVAGRSVPEVITYLTKTLKDGGYMLNPSVSMEVLNYRPFYVLGEIKDPGKYAYVSDMNVLNAVALAGGYTYRAKKDKVLIIRASDPEKKEQVAKPGDQVMPGDIIRIPERFF
ncbi:polysaccharide biosynthesis/export family protein [Sphingomonas montanisoli]|uniref:polysaccharide biosynthesis/export family protein n=1 Tax=Sphingomonas montanisoli TaxID=2606412 RepID=UPI001C6684D4|nr:polysaccharide biosynthesis/export family protein [Sphingomonas montanisoli]